MTTAAASWLNMLSSIPEAPKKNPRGVVLRRTTKKPTDFKLRIGKRICGQMYSPDLHSSDGDVIERLRDEASMTPNEALKFLAAYKAEHQIKEI